MKDFSKSTYKSFAVALAIGSTLLISSVQPASAKQFKKLVETGQIIPGNDRPLARIESPTIGRDGQVAVRLETASIDTSGLAGNRSVRFIGLYSIGRGGNISLLDKGLFTRIDRSATIDSFTAPSISQGKIAYFAYRTEIRSTDATTVSTLKVGTPGDVKQYPAITSSLYNPIRSAPRISFVNGTVYTLETGFTLSGLPTGLERVGLIDTNSPSPFFTVLSVGIENNAIRSASQSLVLLSKILNFSSPTTFKLLERPNGGQFVQLNPQGKNPGSCGFAVSFENVVSCSSEGNDYVLSARFGKKSNFVSLPLPKATTLKSVSELSISNEKIVFKATEQGAAGAIVERIYLSNKTQVPKSVISSGEKLDGKTITGLSLNEDDRSIADNYVVFIATFSDNSKALYRADL